MSTENRTIDDATPDTNVTGVEKIPISDGGVAKYASTAQVKDYTLAQIAAIAAASGIDLSTDGVYLLKGGALKPIPSETLATAVLDYGFGKVAVASMNGNEIVGVKDSTAQKTITVTQLKTWLQANMTVTTDIDIGAKDAAGALSGEDLILIAQSGTNKKLTLTTLTAYVHSAFKDYVTSLTEVTALSDADVFYIVNGTTAKKCTVLQLKTLIGAGDVVGPASTTNNKIPQWDSVTKKLKDGLTLQGTIRASGTASADSVPTEAAVRDALAEVQAPVSSVNTKTGAVALTGSDIPVSGSDATKIDAKIQAIVAASNDFVGATSDTPGTHGLVPAPSIANRNKFLKANGTWADVPTDVTGPSSTTENNIPQWDSTTKKLKDGKGVATEIRGYIEGFVTNADDNHIPTEKAVRIALISEAIDIKGVLAYCGENLMTPGRIPVWGSNQDEDHHPLSDGLSLDTEIPNSPSDTAVLTTKAVKTALDTKPTATLTTSMSAQSTDLQVPSAKAVADYFSATLPNDVVASSTPTTGQALSDRSHYTFNVQTGQTLSLALPSFTSGKSRDFRVAFNQTKPEGSESNTTTVTFTGTGTIISKDDGASNTITLTYDTETTGTEYHVLHFFDMADNMVCVREV